MAFLRSVSRCNQSLAVSRKFSSSIRSGVQRNGQKFTPLNIAKFSRAELLACQKYYIDLRHEINTSCHQNEQKSSMSTVAAVTNKSSLSSAASTSNDQKPERDPLDVSFNDPIAAFKSKTTWELIRAYFVYIMCSSEYLVENNMKVMEFRNDIIWTISYAVAHIFLYWYRRADVSTRFFFPFVRKQNLHMLGGAHEKCCARKI